MSKTMNALLAIVLVGMFPAMAIYQHYSVDNYTPERAEILAINYLKKSPTFHFDGIDESIEVLEVQTLRMLNTWGVTISFTSRNGGYGDRTGQMVTTALQDHTMWIVVSNGKVVEAVTDTVFDEMTGEMLDQGVDESEEAKNVAFDFLMNAPTFGFDGIEGSMVLVDMAIAESFPVQYFITISFDCSQAGYGDRSDMILAQVITTHEAKVVVVEGQVTSAILDGVWDEVNQHEKVSSELHPPESAVHAALDYIQGNYPAVKDVEIPEDWTVSNLNPDNLLGAMRMGYNGGGWDIIVGWAVVMEPVYTVNVSYGEYTWTVEVDQMLKTEEITTQIPIEVMTPDIAKDAAVLYVLENVEGFTELSEPENWTYVDLTPDGLLGYSTHKFVSGKWEVNVSGPVVLEPTYSIEIRYTADEVLEWSGVITPPDYEVKSS